MLDAVGDAHVQESGMVFGASTSVVLEVHCIVTIMPVLSVRGLYPFSAV